MKVLVLSHSRVVRELFRLAAKEEELELETAEDLAELEGDRYDLVFADSALGEEADRIREHLIVGRLVGIRSSRDPEMPGVDLELAKPFVPSDILNILEEYREEAPLDEVEEESLERFLSGETSKSPEAPTRVLDAGEISRIKELLAIAEEEEREEGDTAASPEPSSSLALDGEELLDLLERMKPKRLRKLLAGAEVTVTILFPKERE